MRQTLRDKYESPDTQRVTVILEGGVCAASKEKVVVDDENTSVDIEEQGNGGDYEIGSWD